MRWGGFPNPVVYVSPTQITFDPPQASTLGSVDVTVRQGSLNDTEQLTIQGPSTPRLQVGTGDLGNSVFTAAGIPIIVAGEPNEIHLVVFSKSNVPSPSMFVNLDLGNNYMQVPTLNPFVIDPATGWDDRTLTPNSVPSFTTFYWQSIDLTTGTFPLDVSNLQEILIIF